jgi:hypothetical protein
MHHLHLIKIYVMLIINNDELETQHIEFNIQINQLSEIEFFNAVLSDFLKTS